MQLLKVVIFTQGELYSVPTDGSVEDIIVKCAHAVGILPTYRYLFGIFNRSVDYWICESDLVSSLTAGENILEFRIRYHPLDLAKLSKDDPTCMKYYFLQMKADFVSGRIKELCRSKVKSDKTVKGVALGLGVADMYREMLEQKKSISDVEKDCKKFFRRETLKSLHITLNRDTIRKPLKEIEQNPPGDLLFIMQKYVEQIREFAVENFHESYTCEYPHGGQVLTVVLSVENNFKDTPRIVLRHSTFNELEVCGINDVCFICLRQRTVELSRRNGIPVGFNFPTALAVKSFISCVSGYYRLAEKFMFNLCSSITLPSVLTLMRLRVHAPVGGSFAYSKLEEKRNNAPGSYLIRESHKVFGQYYIDYVDKNSSQPKTVLVTKSSDGFCKEGDSNPYPSLQSVADSLGLTTEYLVPPSENDKPTILLHCLIGDRSSCSKKDGAERPVCIPDSELHVFRGREWELKGKFTTVRRGFWKNGKEEVGIAIKSLRSEVTDSKAFLQALRTCLHWRNDCIASLYGIVLSSTLVPSLVMEYFSLGPLDAFLRKEKDSCAVVDLVEASTYLAQALYYLSERGVVHGKIRSWNVFVSKYSQDSLKVKLADPIVQANLENELAWIPIEYHARPSGSLSCLSTDVWAYGMVLWEIFSFGVRPFDGLQCTEITKSYLYGKRLSKPSSCPIDIYRIMLSCWDLEPSKRKTPQAVMRDMNQIFYNVFNARTKHDYADLNDGDTEPVGREVCLESELCSISSADGIAPSTVNCALLDGEASIGRIQLLSDGSMHFLLESGSENGSSSDYTISSDINDIYVLGKDQLEIGTRIGRGHYGEVCLGALRRKSGGTQTVAVKRLINMENITDTTAFDDMTREFEIMKTLKHPKIVEIIGIIESPEFLLVMEYVPFDSLLKYLRTETDRITDDQLLRYASDVAEGMEYLAEKKIVHRDLAARNILVVNETSVKISDFGLAQRVGSSGFYSFRTLRSLPIPWYAPESIGQCTFSSQSDVWSYGVTLYEMFSRGMEPKLAENEELLKVLESGSRLPCPTSCPQIVYREVMWPCWHLAPSERPTFTDILELLCQVSHQI